MGKALSLYLSLLPIYRSRNLSCTSAHWEISSDKSIQSKQPRTLSRAGPSASTFPPPRISAVIIRLDCPLSFRTSFRSIAFLTPSRRPRWSASPSPPDLIRQRNLEKPPVWTLLIPLLISLQSACHSLGTLHQLLVLLSYPLPSCAILFAANDRPTF